MIKQGTFAVPYYIYSLENHLSYKEKILNLIKCGEGQPSTTYYESISKSDWYSNFNPKFFKENFKLNENSYYSLLKNDLEYVIANIIPDKDKERLMVSNGWFNQYNKLDYYWWHNHPESRWSLIYYLELSDDGPITEFENFFGNSVTLNVKEGDILVFPSWLKHRAPPNLSKNRKTILSFNIVEKS